MARTPKKATRQSLRLSRDAAPIKFQDPSEDESDEIQNTEGEGDLQDPQEEGILDILQKKHVKKGTTSSLTFQTQKKAMYAGMRTSIKEISQAGTAYIENAIAEIQELKTREVSYKSYFADFEQLRVIQETTTNTLVSMYPPLLDDLASRRSDQINSASKMIETNPTRRQMALKKFSKNARVRVEEARENERIATDASALIKHYKGLLHA